MLRGKCGQHVCAALDRLTIVTQRPVRPHDPLPHELILPVGVGRWRWVQDAPEAALTLSTMSPGMTVLFGGMQGYVFIALLSSPPILLN